LNSNKIRIILSLYEYYLIVIIEKERIFLWRINV